MAKDENAARERRAMRPLLERYAEDVAVVDRYYDVSFSADDIEEKRRFFARCRESLDDLDFGGMARDERMDFLLFMNQLDRELRRLDWLEARNREVEGLVPFAGTVARLERSRRRVDPVDPRAVAGMLAELARQVDEARGAVETRHEGGEGADAGEVKKALAFRAAKTVDEVREKLKRWHDFYAGYDPAFTWWTRSPYEETEKALERYSKLVREKILGQQRQNGKGDGKEDGKEDRGEKDEEGGKADAPVIGDPVGRDALVAGLAHAMIPYTPEELVAVGERELAECEREMVAASREMGCGDDWREALDKVKEDHVAPGEQPRLIRDLAVEAIAFLDEHDLVTVPELARRTWRMGMIPPEKQKVNPFFTGGETIRVSYPTDEMPHEKKLMSMRGNNVHFARATVQHELIPGHHLQGFMAKRHRPYRRVFTTPFFFEGWCLYWEMLLWDMGFPKTPANRVGMLFWRMHRCARIVFSLSFHLGRMTADECIELLVGRVGFDRANAEGEVRRSFEGGYDPLYQCAYMIGGLQFKALHEELVKSGRMTNREFHAAALREGSIPVEMVRASLMGQEVTRDLTPSWRFAG